MERSPIEVVDSCGAVFHQVEEVDITAPVPLVID